MDVLASPRGKQTFELNKNVRWANAYDPDDDWPDPAEYTDMIGLLKVIGFSWMKVWVFNNGFQCFQVAPYWIRLNFRL